MGRWEYLCMLLLCGECGPCVLRDVRVWCDVLRTMCKRRSVRVLCDECVWHGVVCVWRSVRMW